MLRDVILPRLGRRRVEDITRSEVVKLHQVLSELARDALIRHSAGSNVSETEAFYGFQPLPCALTQNPRP